MEYPIRNDQQFRNLVMEILHEILEKERLERESEGSRNYRQNKRVVSKQANDKKVPAKRIIK